MLYGRSAYFMKSGRDRGRSGTLQSLDDAWQKRLKSLVEFFHRQFKISGVIPFVSVPSSAPAEVGSSTSCLRGQWASAERRTWQLDQFRDRLDPIRF